jgi:hypothetical protein
MSNDYEPDSSCTPSTFCTKPLLVPSSSDQSLPRCLHLIRDLHELGAKCMGRLRTLTSTSSLLHDFLFCCVASQALTLVLKCLFVSHKLPCSFSYSSRNHVSPNSPPPIVVPPLTAYKPASPTPILRSRPLFCAQTAEKHSNASWTTSPTKGRVSWAVGQRY